MNSDNPAWLICDKGICLYAESRAVGRDRCIKHGALLNYYSRLTGIKTRKEARALLEHDAIDIDRSDNGLRPLNHNLVR